jgi:tuftelin-interacting protein 11
MISRWNPLDDPSAFTATFRMWKALLRTNSVDIPQNQVDIYGTQTVVNAPVV